MNVFFRCALIVTMPSSQSCGRRFCILSFQASGLLEGETSRIAFPGLEKFLCHSEESGRVQSPAQEDSQVFLHRPKSLQTHCEPMNHLISQFLGRALTVRCGRLPVLD